MVRVKQFVFSAKSRLRVRRWVLLSGVFLLLLVFLRLGRKEVIGFLGKMLVVRIYELDLPIAVYGRNPLLSEIFRTQEETKPEGADLASNRLGEPKAQNGEGMKQREWKEVDITEQMIKENRRFQEQNMEEPEEIPSEESQAIEKVEEITEQPPVREEGSPERSEKKKEVDLENYILYEDLLSEFYMVDPGTRASSTMLNAEKMMGMDLKVNRDTQGPQILIYHTHSQEAFADSKEGDVQTGIVGVGEKLADLLSGQYGYQVLHCTEEFDKKSRDEAYSRALPALQKLLEENPSIQVVIDLHRDEMPEKTKLVTELNGKPTARFMFFNGLSWSKKTGQISYLKNTNLQTNLAFSFQLQVKAKEYFPGLTRKIYLKQYRYNMHLCPKTTLIELGAQNNTVEEAMNACEPLAEILDMVLRGE